jgi:hypothetical protein
VSWTVRNTFGPVAVEGRGGPLGSAVSRRASIADGEDKTYRIDVPKGARRLDVSIGDPSDRAADLDLTVLLDGAQVAQSADGDSQESVSLVRPAAGTYTVVVSGYAVPAGSTDFAYQDVFFSPALGRVDVAGARGWLAHRARTTIAGTVVAAAVPASGRTLRGEMAVVTDSGVVVGGGAVAIGEVSTDPPGPADS